MCEKGLNSFYYSASGLPSILSVKNIILVKIILFILFFQGCAFFKSRQTAQRYFTQANIENIIQKVKEQEETVKEFYSTGKLSINGWILDNSVDIFIAGKKEPMMLKMEVSHSWGKPLLHFLIKEGKLEIRDFIEKKQYSGTYTPANLSKFLPNMDCSSDTIWSFLRGYPRYNSYDNVYEGASGVLILEDQKKKRLGTITLSPDGGIKEAVYSPPRFLNMMFRDFHKAGDIYYSEKTVMEDVKGRKDLTLKRNRAVFNKDIPDAIFTIQNQPYFEALNLDDL